jgi:hypothetical protein
MGEIAGTGAPPGLGAGRDGDQPEQPALGTSHLRVGLVELFDQRVDVGHRIDVVVGDLIGVAIGDGFAGRFEHAIDATGDPDRCL